MEDFLYRAVIPLNPKTKKNNQEILYKYAGGKRIPFISQSKTYKQYEKDAGWFLTKPTTPIDYPVNIKCIFYRQTFVRCDLTNLLEAIDDILVKYGVIADDNFNIIAAHDGSRVYVDKEKPRTEIYITKL